MLRLSLSTRPSLRLCCESQPQTLRYFFNYPTRTIRCTLPLKVYNRSQNLWSQSTVSLRAVSSASASFNWRLGLCPTKLKNIEIRSSATNIFQGRHLASKAEDGDGSTDSEEKEVEVKENEDDAKKLRAAERLQSMHRLLDEAQTQAPPKDFDFSDIPQQTQDHQRSGKGQTPKQDPTEMSVFLFPGQGTQFVGMGQKLLEYPNVRDMFDIASEILGYDLLNVCLHGPQEELNRTVHCQPAVFVCSLAAVEKLREEQPKAVENCVAAAGYSVGEFAALVFSGALAFEDAVQLLKVRAEAMQHASEVVPSGMLSVIGRRGACYKMICREAMDTCILNGIDEPVCTIASHLYPEAKVFAGHETALDFIQKSTGRYSLRSAKRIQVSGAFHSPLMAPAKDSFYAAVADAPIETPVIALHSNVNGKRYRHEKHIRTLLKRQLIEPVHWEQTMHEIYQRTRGEGFPKTFEVGPGRQLGQYLMRNNLKAGRSYFSVDV